MREKNKVFSNIVLNNLYRERRTLSKFACLNIKGIRKYPNREKIPDRENIRPTFFHDTDKIMHSLAYTRYIDKAQVFYLFENDHITHRVLHVQFVSKIGRVIGRCLNLNEDLIEAISLGHDLGHVPYGHDGENVLNELCKDSGIGCFCHNVQSVRFLEEIEQRGKGLNLSLQVLDGILAHNGEMLSEEYRPTYGKTWEEFEAEYINCSKDENSSKKIFPMTLEGCVVRISDVIAYIGRDIEDAITLKLIPTFDSC
jgi:dGTPase